MRKTLTLYDLGLIEKDFKFEIVKFGEPSYHGFNPERTMYAKVNGILCEVITKVNIELAKDIEAMTGLNGMKEVEKILKKEAINGL